jgi:hypothetical protein
MGASLRLLTCFLAALGAVSIPAVLVALLLCWGLMAVGSATGLGDLVREHVRGANLDARRCEKLRLQEVRLALLRDVVERDLPWPEAVAAYRAHLRDCGLEYHIVRAYPGQTDEQRFGEALRHSLRVYRIGRGGEGGRPPAGHGPDRLTVCPAGPGARSFAVP